MALNLQVPIFQQLLSATSINKTTPTTPQITHDDYEAGESSGVNKTTSATHPDFIEFYNSNSDDDFQECSATLYQSSIPGRKVTRSTSIEVPPSPQKQKQKIDKRNKKTFITKKGG